MVKPLFVCVIEHCSIPAERTISLFDYIRINPNVIKN